MRRREFISVLGGAITAPLLLRPLAAQAQQPRRVGVLMSSPATDAVQHSYVTAFVQELRQLGWTEGQNLNVDIRWSACDQAVARLYAAELISLRPDAILAPTTFSLEVIRQATSSVAVVFTQVSDPVEQGFVASLTKPGGNLTGFSAYEFSTGGKWLGLLKEAAPRVARVAVMFNPDTSPQSKFFMRSIEAAAASLGIRANAIPLHVIMDIEPAIAGFAREPNGGLILPTDTFTRSNQKQIIELAARHRLPAISWNPDFPRDGGLMSYSVTVTTLEQYRQAAGYVDRILKGAKPADLPVQQADKYALIINLKTAKTLDLNIPLPLLGLADEVVE
jgi:putative ABC transport system substrate-binding protein